MKFNNSSDNALRVLKPPQKPVIRNILKVGFKPLFIAKYTKTIVAIKQPKKFAKSVARGK